MNVIYNKKTGEIDRAISTDQDYRLYLVNYPKELLDNLESLYCEKVPYPLNEFYVDLETKKLKKYSQEEIKEKQLYGRVLTKEERQLEKLKPSLKEIRKAEQTIEILTLLQEVI